MGLSGQRGEQPVQTTRVRETGTGTMPIRVAVDLTSLRPGGENGGIKPFLFETLLWLGRQRRAPLQFLYLTCASTHAEVRTELARVSDELICVRGDGGRLPRGDERAPRERVFIPPPLDLLWQLDAGVLYCPFGSVEFAVPGVCTVGTVVDLLHRDFLWSLDPDHLADRERKFQRMVASADALQCNSEHVVARLREHYGVAPERTFTVYNAVHQRFAVPSTARPGIGSVSMPSAKLLPGTPFFFYPANAWKHKNHETLLLAYGMYRAKAAAARATPWPLVLTGHEDERWAEMRALAQTLGLSGKNAVRFVGYVPAQQFGQLWERAGALVFPSLHEGFGIPLLEAMQHDLPVICGRDGSLLEVGADACLFVDARSPDALAEAMTQVAADESLRQRLVEAGRRRRADFSQDRETARLLDMLVSLAQSRPPYRPFSQGIFPDGWTEQAAAILLPDNRPSQPIRGQLTLRFDPMPAARRLRLRLGKFVALGTFALPAYREDAEINIDCYPDGGPLWMEVLDAANISAEDARTHGVRLHSVNLTLTDGRRFPLFAA